MKWAQITALVLTGLVLLSAGLRHGQEKVERTNFFETFFWVALTFAVYYCAGTFSKVL